jgi:NAD+ synthase (glutamine-hydrolysing)
MRLALAQINTVVGDLDGNRASSSRGSVKRARRAPTSSSSRARRHRLPARRSAPAAGLRARAAASLREIASETKDVVAIVGFPHFDKDLFNACAVCADGEVKAIYRKRFLPNYGVFDEDRYFAPGRELVLLELGETLVGLTICEDMWQPGRRRPTSRSRARSCS